jgi:hypothetical protein
MPASVTHAPLCRFVVLGGSKGHVATFDWAQQQLGCELQLKETVRDVQYAARAPRHAGAALTAACRCVRAVCR